MPVLGPDVLAGTGAVVFPDVERMVVDYLTGLFGTAIPVRTIAQADLDDDDRLIRVQRIGGAWRFRRVLDEAVLDVDVWERDLESLNTAVRTLRAALEAMAGHQSHGGLITKSDEVTGPGRRPEDSPGLFRVGLTHRLLVQTAPAGA